MWVGIMSIENSFEFYVKLTLPKYRMLFAWHWPKIIHFTIVNYCLFYPCQLSSILLPSTIIHFTTIYLISFFIIKTILYYYSNQYNYINYYSYHSYGTEFFQPYCVIQWSNFNSVWYELALSLNYRIVKLGQLLW